ncbi:MAG TPA: hypothetical protein VMJ31_07685 [Methylocystis sp.]|nr:hypothetical protein [Methylocystis sp.]
MAEPNGPAATRFTQYAKVSHRKIRGQGAGGGFLRGLVSIILAWRASGAQKAAAFGALGATLVAVAASATGSSTPFDGKWIIDATATGVLCPVRSKRLGALVASGRFTKILGLPSPQTAGFVDSSGAVTIEIKTLGVTAHVKGNFVGKTGQGEWSSNSFLCPGGGWRAATSGGGPAPSLAKPVTPLAASPISSPIY